MQVRINVIFARKSSLKSFQGLLFHLQKKIQMEVEIAMMEVSLSRSKLPEKFEIPRLKMVGQLDNPKYLSH